MIMWKKVCLLFALLLAGFALSVPHWLTPVSVAQWANRFLAPNFKITLSSSWHWRASGMELPHLSVYSEAAQCHLAEADNLKLNWWNLHRLSAEKLSLDYACLEKLPSDDESKTVVNLTALWGWLPEGELDIESFQLRNAEALSVPAVQPLLINPLQLTLKFLSNKATLAAQVKQQSAVIFRLDSELQPLSDGTYLLSGNAAYQPESGQSYLLEFNTSLNQNLLTPPTMGEFSGHWNVPDFSVPEGELKAQWKAQEGIISATNLTANKPLLDVPVHFSAERLEIKKGLAYWDFDGDQPLKAFVDLTLNMPKEGWFPMTSDVDILLQSFGKLGKGEMVISGKKGEIRPDRIYVPLKGRGDLRYGNTVAYTNLTFNAGGNFEDPLIHFHPGSIFKMDNEFDETKLHVRLPLNDILVGRFGLEGRLQALLQGSTPQFDNIDLKLDGQAREFIAGLKTIFSIRDKRQKLRRIENIVLNRWDWNVQGGAVWKALKTPLQVKGVGFWEGDHIELNMLHANSGKVNTAGVKIPKIELELKDRLRWDYTENHLRGLMQARAEWVEFDYGGRFIRPVFGVGVDGKSISDFNLAGDLKAGALGPLDVRAHYGDKKMVGSIAWNEQSARVFQPLFPNAWEWRIHQGTIKGATDFIIDENGVLMNGNLNVRNGEISLPDGEINGIQIRFPFRYHNYQLSANNKPIQVSMRSIRLGALLIDDAKMAVQGYYPYSRAKPFKLRNISLQAFDGTAEIPSLNFPQTQISEVKLHGIDMDKVLGMADYHHLTLKGRINATLPFWLYDHACVICNGTIEQAETLHLKLGNELVAGLKSGGWTESILVDVVREMNLESLNASVNLAPNGVMNLKSQITGYNPQKKNRNPITLNYNHQENMYELWQMIDYGSQFEQNLEYQLNQ
ncbi:YdbH family protein [Bisgaard Taxon 10/6]|uniref:YdbH family protein n=1 Tax=Exercitatus varius TaxID=67857 RepID=UPI00294AECE0|nr:YdbH family protein [Exercitatus varius]MDG2948461.1 YdbH family protein [Exercitatus varius]